MENKMLFNTGVRSYNRLDKNNKLNLGEFEELKGDILQVVYYLESPAPAGKSPKFLCPADYVTGGNLKNWEFAIKIIGGGTLSDYAIFNK